MANFFDGVIEEASVKPPIAVLKELGKELEKITKGLLVGNVEQAVVDSSVELNFYITAPSLNNYSYQVFTITHNLNFYPLVVKPSIGKWIRDVENQEELEEKLKEVFSSSEVKKVINGLLTQIKSA